MPSVLGHEVAGIVAAVGPDVAQIRLGITLLVCSHSRAERASDAYLAAASSAGIRSLRFADRLTPRV